MSDKDQLDRIENTLNKLLEVIQSFDNDDDDEVFAWDGDELPRERDETQEL